ncbi:MAG: sigma-70 family RNA polymerase sigma factor [Planctomycetota bacterium]
MSDEVNPHELMCRAAGGDGAALENLLLLHYDRLVGHLARKLPDQFRGLIAPEDVLQEAFIVAFREIATFVPRGPDAFFAWLAAIAEHRLFDMVKAQRALKRGGGRAAVDAVRGTPADSLSGLLDVLCVDAHTPSRSVAGHEAARAIQIGLASLRADYREALRLRYIVGLPVAEVAERMARTEAAVHMLCHRGLEQLRCAIGRSSQFFSRR